MIQIIETESENPICPHCEKEIAYKYLQRE